MNIAWDVLKQLPNPKQHGRGRVRVGGYEFLSISYATSRLEFMWEYVCTCEPNIWRGAVIVKIGIDYT